VATNEAKLGEINAELNTKISEMVEDFDRDKRAALDRLVVLVMCAIDPSSPLPPLIPTTPSYSSSPPTYPIFYCSAIIVPSLSHLITAISYHDAPQNSTMLIMYVLYNI